MRQNRRPRRTKKAYTDLYENPYRLFPGNGKDNKPVSVTLFPNGEGEIWVQGSGGKGYRIKASEGPAGLGLEISTFIGSPPMTISGNATGEVITGVPDARHLNLCLYNPDEHSQAFKRAYQAGNLNDLEERL